MLFSHIDYTDTEPLDFKGISFKSKDGKSFVVQVIKTCVFPINYAHTIIKNESPFKSNEHKKDDQQGEH